MARIETLGTRLSQRALDAMYMDPFWDARFGGRGRLHADEDSAYHVRYLLEALRRDDPRIMIRYAVWLRSVLVTRGMCSAHLDDNFARLSHLLESELGEAAEPALRMLAAARAALAYETGPGARLLSLAAPLRASAEARLSAAEREATVHGGEEHAHPSSLLSYLADALQLARPDLFLAHIKFLADFYQRRGRSQLPLAQLMRALSESAAELPALEPRTSRAAVELFDAAALVFAGEQRGAP